MNLIGMALSACTFPLLGVLCTWPGESNLMPGNPENNEPQTWEIRENRRLDQLSH